jgi:hypothetical protein
METGRATGGPAAKAREGGGGGGGKTRQVPLELQDLYFLFLFFLG